MKRRLVLLTGITLLLSVAAFGQANLTGKWQTATRSHRGQATSL